MKKILVVAMCLAIGHGSIAQTEEPDSLGLPGDNLSLFGVLELFKKSENIEDFEKKLNAEGSNINNLDLDSNGEVDYIMVNDKSDGESHAFMLSVEVAEGDIQDLACVAIEKKGSEEAALQVIGDEEYYGKDYYIEPSDEMKSGGKGSSAIGLGIYVNVWVWPCVRYVYHPAYVVWVSPWSWRVRPLWWNPWRPWAWQRWHPVAHRHVTLHVRTRTCHVTRANNVYVTHRQVRAKSRPSVNRQPDRSQTRGGDAKRGQDGRNGKDAVRSGEKNRGSKANKPVERSRSKPRSGGGGASKSGGRTGSKGRK